MNSIAITVNDVKYVRADSIPPQSDKCGVKGDKAHTFLEIGKPYLFRTVTMIYTGRLVAVSEQEFLVKEAAWIPDTERWMDAVTKSSFKEVEPYGEKPVVICRGGMLDVVEIPELVRKQK